ncbi:hypothetical protein CcaverHIS002_0411950 [Cutaneotrichosporon cavernicola]|nr:hypothetical protein CcaverHIS002_0411950 [Cutaneotrichosporon cavernicola]
MSTSSLPKYQATSSSTAFSVELHYDSYPHIVENIISHLPRTTLIPLRLSCRGIRDRVDSVLSRGVSAWPAPPPDRLSIGDIDGERLPALFPLCGLPTLPQPHILDNPNVHFPCGKREQIQAANRALMRVAAAVRCLRLSTDELWCRLLVPFLRQVPPLDVLQVSHITVQVLWQPQAIPSDTVVLGTVGGNVFNKHVPFRDPGVRYTPNLRKVVFNCDAETVLHFDRVLEPLYPSRENELIRDCQAVRMMVQLAHPVQFVLIFHPVPEIARNRLRAIVCKALYLAIIHDVRVLFVNTVVLPSSMFPFKPSDPVLGVDSVSSFPEEARRVGSAPQSLQTFAQTCAIESDRITFCTMDEYRERVGKMRFEEETYADSNLSLQRNKYQKLWEKARRNRRDTFEDEGESQIRNGVSGLGFSGLLAAPAPAQANPAPTQTNPTSAFGNRRMWGTLRFRFPGLSAAAPAAVQAAPAPLPAAPAPLPAAPAPAQANPAPTQTNPTSAVGNRRPVPVPANAAASSLDSTSQRRWGTLRFRDVSFWILENAPAPTNTVPAPASVTQPSPQLSSAAVMASVNLDQALVQALASLVQSQSTAREARGNKGSSGSRDDEQQ